MSGIYLTSYQGVPIHVTEDGAFTCTYLGEAIRRHSLRDLKRRIRGREIVPVACMVEFDISFPHYHEEPVNIVALDGTHGEKYVHTDGRGQDTMRELSTLYHYDLAAIDEAFVLDKQIAALRAQRDAIVKRLRPVAYEDLMPVKAGDA